MWWYYLESYWLYFVIVGPALLFAIGAQIKVKTNFNKYSRVMSSRGLTGANAAMQVLSYYGIHDVQIERVSGKLSDHYDPKSKKIRLSSDIYKGDTIAAASVAAHECGHAIQHKENYTFLKIRSSLVPVVNFSTKIGYVAVMIGLLCSSYKIAVIGLILLLAMLLFQIITLPVEFNASNRAKKQLIDLNIIDTYELQDSKTMLNAAALTYVASLITTLLQILRLAMIVLGRRDD